MKCPKCHYLSFEPEARCRNCGYDLALIESDLALRPPDPELAPLSDLRLRGDEEPVVSPVPSPSLRLVDEGVRPARAPRPVRHRAVAVLEEPPPIEAAPMPAPPAAMPAVPSIAPPAEARVTSVAGQLSAISGPTPESAPPVLFGQPALPSSVALPPPPAKPAAPARSASPTTELPLFVKAVPDPAEEFPAEADEPLIGVPVAPRPPLAVRRRPLDPPRAASTDAANRKFGPMERDFIDDLDRLDRETVQQERAEARALVRRTQGDLPGEAARPVRRLAAAVVDLALFAGIGAAVIALTLRLCGLTLAQIGVLPIAPLAAFGLVIAFGYLMLFTVASGQTIGKMCAGLRVVGSASPDGPSAETLTTAQAASRAALTLPSLLPLGLGFLPALFGGRALHDRLSETRVVRA